MALLVVGGLLLGGLGSQATTSVAGGESDAAADTALLVAVDVSRSVDAERFRLQMEGIAQALEDPAVIDTILSGSKGRIRLAMVTWADKAELAMPWRTISSREDAVSAADQIRALPQTGGEFTCVARMMEHIAEHIEPEVRGSAIRFVIDVSGDGIDNCNTRDESDRQRDRLVASGATINGLPILVPGENEIVGGGAYRAPSYGLNNLVRGPDTDTTTLEAWFTDHIIGGPGAFILSAQGYDDFGRAFRKKFVTEISAATGPSRPALVRADDAGLVLNRP